MEDSFVLLSSMSPKVTKTTKIKHKKVPRLLSLKKSIRRSTVFDNLAVTEKNESLILIESSTTASTESRSSCADININKNPQSPIVISDSENSESDKRPSGTKLKEKNNILRESKYTAISDWVLKVNAELENGHNSKENLNYGSTVCKDKAQNFNVNVATCKPENYALKEDLILSNKTEKLKSNSISSISSDNGSDENILDELYGNSWRHARNLILSEPRRKKSSVKKIHRTPKTEVKRNLKLHQNPYLDSEQKRSENFSTKVVESPWSKRLDELCDSDTSSDPTVDDIIKKYTTKARTKLLFDKENENGKSKEVSSIWHDKSVLSSTRVLSVEKSVKSVEFSNLSNSDKENFSDLSDRIESLEDKFKKKLTFIDKPKPTVSKKKEFDKNADIIKGKKDCRSIQNALPDIAKEKPKKKGVKNKNTENATNDLKQKPLKIRNELDLNKKTDSSTSNSCLSFLASLSKTSRLSQCDPAARIFRNSFQTYKKELATRLFKLYNERIFNNAIPEDSPLEWNDRMRGTAGFCYCKKVIRRTGQVERKIRIVLSTKVVDSADRLRDTLIHEMCHAATWVVNEVANGHGQYWKAWTMKALQVFPELPPINRCHSYQINTKYTYRCIDCGYSIGRHSKSLNIEKKRCGYCYGKFEVLINKKSKDGETKSVPVTPKKEVTGFALFVKENYGIYKTSQLNHGQVMKLLGEKFNELKVTINKG